MEEPVLNRDAYSYEDWLNCLARGVAPDGAEVIEVQIEYVRPWDKIRVNLLEYRSSKPHDVVGRAYLVGNPPKYIPDHDSTDQRENVYSVSKVYKLDPGTIIVERRYWKWSHKAKPLWRVFVCLSIENTTKLITWGLAALQGNNPLSAPTRSVAPRSKVIRATVVVSHLCSLLEIVVMGRDMAALTLALEHRKQWSVKHPTKDLLLRVLESIDVQSAQDTVIEIYREGNVLDTEATAGANTLFHTATGNWWLLSDSTEE